MFPELHQRQWKAREGSEDLSSQKTSSHCSCNLQKREAIQVDNGGCGLTINTVSEPKVMPVQSFIEVKRIDVRCFFIRFLIISALILVQITTLPIYFGAWAHGSHVPILLVHGFQIGAIHPRALSPGAFDLREGWKEMAAGLANGRQCRFVPISVRNSSGQRLWTFWKVKDHLIYISNYTENVRIPSITCIGVYASLLAKEIQEIKRRESINKIDIVSHSMGGLVSRAYIERCDFREGDGALLFYDYAYGKDVRKLIMLGTPNHGSPITDIAKLLGVRLKAMPAFSVKQMHPGSKFLRLLNSGRSGRSLGVEYSAIAGNVCPCTLWNKFWAELCSKIGIEIPAHTYCEIFEKYHGCGDNDLVVAVESVRLSEIPSQRYIIYQGVDHGNLLHASIVVRKVRLLLL